MNIPQKAPTYYGPSLVATFTGQPSLSYGHASTGALQSRTRAYPDYEMNSVGLLQRLTGTLSLPRRLSASCSGPAAATFPSSHRLADDMLWVSTRPRARLLSLSPGRVKYSPACQQPTQLSAAIYRHTVPASDRACLRRAHCSKVCPTAVENEVEAPGDQQQDEQGVAQRVRIRLLQRLVWHRRACQRPLKPKHPLRHQPCSATSPPSESDWRPRASAVT